MDLERALHEANRDPTVHGIMIFYPVFGQEPSFDGGSMDDYLRDSIAPEKDVEGLCHTFRSNLYRNIRFMDEGGCIVYEESSFVPVSTFVSLASINNFGHSLRLLPWLID
jgi:hypothetical protein